MTRIRDMNGEIICTVARNVGDRDGKIPPTTSYRQMNEANCQHRCKRGFKSHKLE